MITVEPPPPTPYRYGLLEAATVATPADPHAFMGVQFQPECGIAHLTPGACMPYDLADSDVGPVTVNVGTTRNAALNGTVGEAGDYVIDWGDGTTTVGSTLTGRSHTYTADGTYTVTVDGPNGYYASLGGVVVTNGAATGPFTTTAYDTSPATKVVDTGRELVEVEPFAVYRLHQCQAVGGLADAETRATRAFELAEGRAVEEWFARFLSTNPAAVDLTPASGAVHPANGLALLEGVAADDYGGVPVIHASRGLVTILDGLNLVERQGGHIETILGSLVAAGGGYSEALVGPNGEATDPGAAWLYVTGRVFVWRGAVLTTEPVLDLSPPTNVFSILAERPYLVATECIIFAVQVDLSMCCAGTGGVVADPASGDDLPVLDTGTDTIEGPGGTWTPPASGNLRAVTVTVTSGSVEVDGDEVTAPNSVSFAAARGEDLDAPTVTADDDNDRAVVSWVVAP